ncbi:MAG: hypothetical protein NVS1B4_17150 [Gemmatimonadaceae bacterium]
MTATARGWLVAGVAVLVACTGRPSPMGGVGSWPSGGAASPPPSAGRATDAEIAYLIARRLIVPVDGVRVATIPDSFDEVRGGGRLHRAIDIRAPRGTPVRAADAGTVFKVNSNSAGGLVIYTLDPARRYVYYYAHLSRYSDTLREGMTLAKGDLLGYVGTTGNAPKNEPHLHFQLMRLDDPKRWWDGTPVDPLPFLNDRDHGPR